MISKTATAIAIGLIHGRSASAKEEEVASIHMSVSMKRFFWSDDACRRVALYFAGIGYQFTPIVRLY